MNFNSNATAGGKAVSVSDFTFDSMLDETCERLLDRQLRYSIQRIHEMEKRLIHLERELDEFITREQRTNNREQS
jgi:hypothetical protein